jgi:hypothetical protein
MALSQNVLDLEFLLADACRFIPMDLREADRPVLKSNLGYPLALSPSATPIQLSESRYLSDTRADGERLDLRDVADDREIHASFCTIGRPGWALERLLWPTE